MTEAKQSGKRSRAIVSKLEKTVEEEKQKLANLLEGKVLSVYPRCLSTNKITPADMSCSTKREYELKDTLIKTILYAKGEQPELHEKGVKRCSVSKLTASAIRCRAKSNIASSRELLGRYEQASQQVAFPKGVLLMESECEKDNQTLKRILDKQREKTKLEVYQLLSEDSRSLKEQVEGDTSTLDNILWDQFAVGGAKKGPVKALGRRKGETWAAVAKNAQRGVRRAVKDLADDNE